MKFNSVRVILGPSYASRRAETVQSLINLAQAVPQVGQIGADLIAKNMDFDGSEDLASRLRAVLPPQVLQATNPEAAAAMQPPPDQMAELQAQGAAQMMNSELEAAAAKTEQERAKAAQEIARVDGVKLDNALKVKKLREPPPRPAQGEAAGLNHPAE